MYTHTLVNQKNTLVKFTKSSKLNENHENHAGNEDVSLDSEEWDSSCSFNLNSKDLHECLSSLNSKVEKSLEYLLKYGRNKQFSSEVNYFIKLLKDFLKNSKIEEKSRNLLEISLLILIFLKDGDKGGNEVDFSRLRCTQEFEHKFDLCPEVVNALVNQRFLFENVADESLNFLVNICLWAIETSKAPNVVQLCYEILVLSIKLGHRSKLILPYIENVLSSSFVICSTSYSEAQYQKIYWSIRILQAALARNIINSKCFERVLEFGLNSTKLQNKSIYILNEAACLLAQLWLIEPFEFDLLCEDKLKLMVLSKLLAVGDESFLQFFSMDYLVKLAVAGPIDLRKLAINCLNLRADTRQDEIFNSKIDHLTYKNNFKHYKSLLPRIDLGILTVKAKFLPNLKGSISYLHSLHNLLNNIFYLRRPRKIIIYENGHGIIKPEKTEYTKFIVQVNNVMSGKMSKGRFMEWLKWIKINLKRNYYSIFQVVNAIIATRSVMYSLNSMGIKVQHTDDLSIYFLLRLDGTYRSICRDYIGCLTISSNHIDFSFITYIIETIHKSLHARIISRIVVKTLLIGVCEYLEILLKCNVRDIYGINYPRINEMCSEILVLFEELVKSRVSRADFGLLSHVVSVLKLVYEYDESTFKRVVSLFLRIIRIYEERDLSLDAKYRERIDGCKKDLKSSIIDLYLALSTGKLPFKIHERAILELDKCQNVVNLCVGLMNSVSLYSNKELIQTLAFQLSLLQVQDFDSKSMKTLKKLANVVFMKLNRDNCTIVTYYKGRNMFEFKSYKFKIIRDSINKCISQLINLHLQSVSQVYEIKLFNPDYTVCSDFMILTRFRLVGVSSDVLSSVPWAGTSRLVSIMDQVVQRGPNDQKTWNILTRRADLIMDSFSSNNLSRMVVLLTKSPLSDVNFKEKLKKQSLKMVQESDLLSCCGFLFGFSKMGVSDLEIALKFREKIIEQLSSAKNSYPLALILSVYCKNKDEKMVKLLLKELVGHMETMTPKSFSMVITDVLSNFNSEEIFSGLDPFIIQSLKCMKDMDLRSLLQLYSVFCTTNHPLKGEYLQNLSRNISPLVNHATLHQLSVILRGYSKSLVDTELLQLTLASLKSKYSSGELQELLFILSHLLKLNLTGNSPI
ncbi:uncharacterized protein TA14015 [Theileria annulata]|uniref:Uncharacterized protein n=1 Tax=Theileria annulata TaxID=5874 RepID=Q4UEU4_THEAN|nr:uncharacterized protein TA14015 [Theileria annulata]CAI74395.1 hypothetical protein TA14015 [Theileria annulata]|eukprot:XP_952127.1 hypothetical protein TA14015 [Theileria annulata]